MLRFVVACVLTASFVSSVNAQQGPPDYVYQAMLGPQDFVNSRGQALPNTCTAVQQDRANFHRFGKRDAGDTNDPYFASRDLRATMPSICQIAPAFDRQIMADRRACLQIFVYAPNGRPNQISVLHCAG